jgi:hypothetical protein
MDRNAHAADLLEEIAPDGATTEQRQHVKDMLKVGVSDSDIRNLYAQGLGVGQGPALASSGIASPFADFSDVAGMDSGPLESSSIPTFVDGHLLSPADFRQISGNPFDPNDIVNFLPKAWTNPGKSLWDGATDALGRLGRFFSEPASRAYDWVSDQYEAQKNDFALAKKGWNILWSQGERHCQCGICSQSSRNF